eukprot:560444-Amphidinium_carterae.1
MLRALPLVACALQSTAKVSVLISGVHHTQSPYVDPGRHHRLSALPNPCVDLGSQRTGRFGGS